MSYGHGIELRQDGEQQKAPSFQCTRLEQILRALDLWLKVWYDELSSNRRPGRFQWPKAPRFHPCECFPHLWLQNERNSWNVNCVKMNLWKCELCEKWDLENVNFVKLEILKNVNFVKIKIWKCEFCETCELWFFKMWFYANASFTCDC